MANTVIEYLPTILLDDDTLKHDIPFADNIRLITPEMILSAIKPVNYGDMVNIKFWKLIGLPFGHNTDTPLHKQAGYTYRLYAVTRIFKVIDNHGTEILERQNIQSMADMRIDFDIYKSHQFEIIIDGELAGVTAKFLIPAKDKHIPLKPYTYTYDVVGGIDESIEDENKDYTHFDIYCKYNKLWGKYKYFLGRYVKTQEMIALPEILKYDYDNISNFITDEYEDFTADENTIVLKGKAIEYIPLGILLTASLFPSLFTPEMAGEKNITRPLYEPWLIWKVLEFIYNHRTEDLDNEYPFPILDLSPNWAY